MERQSSERTAWIIWLSVAQMVSWGSVFYLFALILQPVEQELGLGRGEASLAFSLALLAEGVLAWPVGRWIERGFARAVMSGGSVLLALGLALHGMVQGLWSFYAVWLLLGAGLAGTLYPPAFAVLIRRFPSDYRRAIILMTFLGGLASTVFLPLEAWLIDLWGWRGATWPLAAMQLLLCLPIHALLLRGESRTTPRGTRAHAAPVGLHLRSRSFVLVGLFIVLIMGVTAAIPPHLVSLLRDYRLPEAWVIAVPAAVGVLQVLGRALLYWGEHHLDVHRVNRLIPCLLPVGIAVLLVAPGLGQWAVALQTAAVLLFVLLYGMGNGMFTIVKGTAMAQYVSQEQAASLNGALGLPMALARAALPWVLGVLWTAEHGYRSGLWLLLGLCLIGIAALMRAQRSALEREADNSASR